MPSGFLDRLELVIAHPLAFAAYVLLIAGWLYYGVSVRRIKVILKGLKRIDDPGAIAAARFILKPDFTHLSSADRYKALRGRQLLVAYICTVAAIIVLAALGTYAWTLPEAEVSRRLGHIEKGIAEISAVADELARELSLQQRRSVTLLIDVAESAGYAEAHAPLRPEIRRLSERLKSIVRRFEGSLDPDSLSPAQDRDLRQARALIANAERRYNEALELVTQIDESAATDGLVRVLMVRASALYGLARWDEAGSRYRRILTLDPADIDSERHLTMCLIMLTQHDEALQRLSGLVPRYERRLEVVESQDSVRSLVECLTSRGYLLAAQNEHEQAFRDFDRAATHAASSALNGELVAACLSNRASSHRSLGRVNEGLSDLDAAIDAFQSAISEASDRRLGPVIAHLILSRTVYLLELEKSSGELIGHASLAVEWFDNLYRSGNRPGLAAPLTEMLYHRALLLFRTDQVENARADLDRAIVLGQQLDDSETDLIAKCRELRARIHVTLELWNAANDDYAVAIGLVVKLIDNAGDRFLLVRLAELHEKHAKNLARAHRFEEAVGAYVASIGACLGALEDGASEQLAGLAARMFYTCHVVVEELGRLDLLRDELDDLIRRSTSLVADSRFVELEDVLAQLHLDRALLSFAESSPDRLLADLDKAITLFVRSMRDRERTELHRAFTTAVRVRQFLYEDRDDGERAGANLDLLIETYTWLFDRFGTEELREGLATAHNARGLFHIKGERLVLAEADLAKAVAMLLNGTEPAKLQVKWHLLLAGIFQNRAAVAIMRGRVEDARSYAAFARGIIESRPAEEFDKQTHAVLDAITALEQGLDSMPEQPGPAVPHETDR